MTQLTPQSMTVDVTVSMPLQPFYAATTLTEKSSLLQLFSSIIGLAGIMVGVQAAALSGFSGVHSLRSHPD